MEMREKLKKILEYIDGVCPSGLSCYNCQHKDVEEGCSILAKVDYLIANGVEIPVRCKDCQHRGDIVCPMYNEEYIHWAEAGYEEGEWVTHDYSCDNGFCHMGERRSE